MKKAGHDSVYCISCNQLRMIIDYIPAGYEDTS